MKFLKYRSKNRDKNTTIFIKKKNKKKNKKKAE
jgi:hypothetical protein